MMNRRGFLGGILAALAAPAVVKSGVLMPVKPRIYTGEIGQYEGFRFIESPQSGVLVPEPHRGAMLKIFTAAGTLLATIPMGDPRVEQFDYGRRLGIALDGGVGDVIQSGVADSFELVGVGAAGNVKGRVGPGGLNLDNRCVVTGQNISVSKFGVMRDKAFDLTYAGEPFDDRPV